MANVEIPVNLLERTEGKRKIEVEGHNVRQMLRALDDMFPGIAAELKATSAIAIDGEIIGQYVEDANLERLEATTEVCFIPAVAGGS
jgi:molybdopterin converting factor small subunit